MSLEVRLSSIVDGELARAAQINARCACAFAGMDAIVPVGMAFRYGMHRNLLLRLSLNRWQVLRG